MQVFGNVATAPERLISKRTGRTMWQLRLAESHRGLDSEPPTWYTVRIMKEADPQLAKGDFVKVTGRLKADYYVARNGSPSGTLLILAFEAAKIAKPAVPATACAAAAPEPVAPQATPSAPETHQTTPPHPRTSPMTTTPLVFDWED